MIGGHRRLDAYRRLLAETPGNEGADKYGSIPAHEKINVSDEEMALFGLVENLQRDAFSPLDAALGLLRFQKVQQLATEPSPSGPGWSSIA